MKKIGNFILFLIILSIPMMAFSKSDVSAVVDQNKIALGEVITLTVSVETSDSVNVNSPRLPSLEGFNIVGQSDSVQARSTFINGQFQYVQTKNFHFVLSPIKQGRLIIGPVEVSVGNQTLRTKPISVDVGAPGSGSRAAPQGGQQAKRPRAQQQDPLEEDPFFQDADDLFSQLLQRRGVLPGPGGIKTQPINENEAFFIQLEVDKTSVFEGEQVTANYYLMTPYNIRDIDTLKYPSLKGFWKEDIEIATRLNFQREVINGIAYNKALLASYALFPLKAGKVQIDSYKAKCTVVTQQNMLGIGTPYSFTKVSQPVSIEAKPLPKDKPQDFSGAVGVFKVSSKLEAPANRVPVNQPFSLKIRIEGQGNAKVIELPSLQLPPDLEMYDTKVDSKFFRDGTSYKEFELFLIPRKQGKFTIPSVTISSFDTSKGQYIQSQTNSFDIQVVEGRAGESYQASPLSLSGAKESPQQKRGQELPPPTLEYAASRDLDAKTWALIWGLGLTGIVVVLFFKLRRELGLGQRKRGLQERVQKRLKDISRSVSQNDYRKVGAEGINTINVVLGELSKDGAADASFEKLILKTPPSVRRELEKELSELVSYFHLLAFAPTQLAEQMSSQAKEKFRRLDRTLMKAIEIGADESVN